MKEITEDKGRVRPVVEGDFQCDENGNSTRFYEILSIVGIVDNTTKLSYISKKNVPVGIPITNEEYWYPFQVIAVPKGDKGDDGKSAYDLYIEHGGTIASVEEWLESLHGADGISPILRISPDGLSIEISSDNGQTWLPFQKDFNKLRVLGYVDSVVQLPASANIGDIYGVWNQEAQSGAGAYELYIQTVRDWILDYTITKVYDYDTELPSSAADGTAVLVPVTDLTLDKEKIDGYKVYRYSLTNNGWIMILNTAEIYANKTDIINYGDNIYALVQSATEGTYELYKRSVGWVQFGTNASITYHLIQNIQEGTEQNILSGLAVKDAINVISKGTNMAFGANPSIIYKGVVTQVTLTATMRKSVPSNIKIFDGNTVIAEGSSNPLVHSSDFTLNGDKTFTTEGITKNVIFGNDVIVQARYPIYYGFAASATALAIDANRYAPTTNAAHTYTKTNDVDNQHFYILVPSDISALSVFTMGGAPFVMNSERSETINGIVYKVYESAYTYNANITLKVSAS